MSAPLVREIMRLAPLVRGIICQPLSLGDNMSVPLVRELIKCVLTH